MAATTMPSDLSPPGGAERSVVTLRRDRQDDLRQGRIFARLDAGAYHEFTFGYSVTVEVKPGDHTLRMGRDRRPKAIRFSVAADEHALLTLVARAPFPGTGFLMRLFKVPPRVTVFRSKKGPPATSAVAAE